jgi:hypothetical protein
MLRNLKFYFQILFAFIRKGIIFVLIPFVPIIIKARPFIIRWFFSTNHKDIGTLYLILAIISGIINTVFSVLIRLTSPNDSIFKGNAQLYNSIIIAHCLHYVIMIFLILSFTLLIFNTNKKEEKNFIQKCHVYLKKYGGLTIFFTLGLLVYTRGMPTLYDIFTWSIFFGLIVPGVKIIGLSIYQKNFLVTMALSLHGTVAFFSKINNRFGAYNKERLTALTCAVELIIFIAVQITGWLMLLQIIPYSMGLLGIIFISIFMSLISVIILRNSDNLDIKDNTSKPALEVLHYKFVGILIVTSFILALNIGPSVFMLASSLLFAQVYCDDFDSSHIALVKHSVLGPVAHYTAYVEPMQEKLNLQAYNSTLPLLDRQWQELHDQVRRLPLNSQDYFNNSILIGLYSGYNNLISSSNNSLIEVSKINIQYSLFLQALNSQLGNLVITLNNQVELTTMAKEKYINSFLGYFAEHKNLDFNFGIILKKLRTGFIIHGDAYDPLWGREMNNTVLSGLPDLTNSLYSEAVEVNVHVKIFAKLNSSVDFNSMNVKINNLKLIDPFWGAKFENYIQVLYCYHYYDYCGNAIKLYNHNSFAINLLEKNYITHMNELNVRVTQTIAYILQHYKEYTNTTEWGYFVFTKLEENFYNEYELDILPKLLKNPNITKGYDIKI